MQSVHLNSAKLGVLLLAVLLTTSCLILTEESLIAPHPTTVDKQLRGRWEGTDKLEGVYALFDGRASLESNIFTGKEPGAKSEGTFDVTNGRIGKYWYLSLKPRDDKGDKGYLLVRYAIQGKQMKLWLLDSPLIDAAISDGSLKGDKSSSANTLLTGDADAIRAFIIAHENADGLFEYLGMFKKAAR